MNKNCKKTPTITMAPGKLCSVPEIDNTDLYFAFYTLGGYTPAQIARLFGKNYHVIYAQIQRKLDPLNNKV